MTFWISSEVLTFRWLRTVKIESRAAQAVLKMFNLNSILFYANSVISTFGRLAIGSSSSSSGRPESAAPPKRPERYFERSISAARKANAREFAG